MRAKRNPEWCSADAAMARVGSGMTVACTSLSAEPIVLTSALWRRARELDGITLLTGMMVSGYPFLKDDMRGKVKLRTWFMPGTLLKGLSKKLDAEFLPLTWCQATKYMKSASIDVALLQVSPADGDGNYSFGLSTAQSRAMVESAKTVIVQVNPAMPRTCGDSLIHESEIDVLVDAQQELPLFPHREGDAADRVVGELAAQFVGDGATIQMGIGIMPGAFVDALIALGRKNLRVVSMVTDPIMRLIDAGCCIADNPKAIAVDVLGSPALYRWVENNPAIHMADSMAINTAESLADRGEFVAVNSALEIDLWGQVNTERLDALQAGGVGGSLDFMVGAQVVDGLSIIALRSTASRGQSRIVERLQDPVVTIPRHLLQVVVTEFGVADLRNLSVRERAVALARIAHPDYQERLLARAMVLD